MAPNLRVLLDELDAWGDQRIRVGQFQAESLLEFQSRERFSQRIYQANMEHLLGGQIPLSPGQELEPVQILYKEDAEQRSLVLFAAKTRPVMQPQPQIPDFTDEENYPEIIFKPFKLEHQKVVACAEIDLRSGAALISTALFRQGFAYKAEFEEFYEVFEPLLSFKAFTPVPLFAAVGSIRHLLTKQEVRIRNNKRRTSSGGAVDHSSHSSKVDLREDPELLNSEIAVSGLPGTYCNCYWEPSASLPECVHTHVFAPTGEVSVLGQVREQSVRYVLRRILAIN